MSRRPEELPPVKVLSIVGPGRSGSTVVASLLGESAGVVSSGELRWLWSRGILDGRSCACGAAPTACPVWSQVLARLGESTSRPAVRDVLRAQEEVSLRRNRLRVLRSVDHHHVDWPALMHLRQVSGDLCRAIGEVTGARVVVDSSKRAHDAAVLAGIESIEHYVLHIVRDPRAVAHSWRRRKPAGDPRSNRTMATRGLLPSAVKWAENCASAETLRRQVRGERWMFTRYEDFVVSPRHTIERALAMVDEACTLNLAEDGTVELTANHIVAGNPSRFIVGRIGIKADDEWTRVMPPRDQWAVSLVGWPFLRRYDYPLRPVTPAEVRTGSATRQGG